MSLIGDNIIFAEFCGSFDNHALQRYSKQIKKLVSTFNGSPFAMLIDDLKLEGGTPEAYKVLNEYNQWLNQQAIVAKAFIINNNVNKQIILKRSPALLEQNIAFFTDKNSAKDWLNTQLNQPASSAQC